MIIRANSHRAVRTLKNTLGEMESYYYKKNFLHDKSKGYFIIPDEEVSIRSALRIKGISKPKDQRIENYGKCW